MSDLLNHFGRQSTVALLIKAYLTIVVITVLDYITGVELSLLILYFFPVIVVSWFLGKWQGIWVALAATLATALHDLLLAGFFSGPASQDAFHYWRFLQRGGVFLIVTILVAALRASQDEKRTIEHRLARKVQSFLLPQAARSLGSLNCFGLCRSSDHLTGDFFDLIPLGPTKLAILVGDICGKGISAALLMAYVQGLLRSYVPFDNQRLGALMSNINRSLYLATGDDKFATLFVGVYDDETSQLSYVNAGHEPPVILRAAEYQAATRGIVHEAQSIPMESIPPAPLVSMKLQNGGLLLGVDPDAEYETSTLELRPGDVFVCDTDGVKEAMNEDGEMYGVERLMHIVMANHPASPREIHSRIFQDIDTFVGNNPQADDMTLVVATMVSTDRTSQVRSIAASRPHQTLSRAHVASVL